MNPSFAPPAGVPALGVELGQTFLSLARRMLQDWLAAPDVLAQLEPPPVSGTRYARTLVHADPAGRFGVWALWWPPGSATPIHDHHCDCMFGVLSGRLRERHYERTTGRGADARVIASHELQAGYIRGNAYESGVIHQMANDGSAMCVSLHVYAYAPHHAPSSIRQCFTAIDGGDAKALM
jgi:predicted metal-dependent enzyme (double-stranded beta helix superfamily)